VCAIVLPSQWQKDLCNSMLPAPRCAPLTCLSCSTHFGRGEVQALGDPGLAEAVAASAATLLLPLAEKAAILGDLAGPSHDIKPEMSGSCCG
jgi:hypothetical protein